MAEFWDVLDAEGSPLGRVSERGKPLAAGEYHLVIHAWIRQSDGRFVISRRHPDKPWGLWWECTSGSAVAGDGSLATALKEAREELGVVLDPGRGRRLYRDRFDDPFASWIADCWLFEQDIALEKLILQREEVVQARLASIAEIGRMVDQERFVPYHFLGREPWNLVRADGQAFGRLPEPRSKPQLIKP